MRIIIRNAMIFDGTGTPRRPGCVVVEGERITAVLGQNGEPAAQLTDIEIDAAGKTLMPGMVESHAHLSWPSSTEQVYNDFVLPPDEMRIATWRNARILLDHGFTSAYSAGALGEWLEAELARDIEAGRTPGPRLVPSTIERAPEGDRSGIEHGRGPEAMRSFMRSCKAMDVKSVKLVVSGESAMKPGSSHDILYDAEELKAAGEEAERLGLWIAVHAYTSEAVKMAVTAGARVLYHCSYADTATLDLLEEERDEIFYAPAIGVLVATTEMDASPHVDVEPMKANAREVIALDKALIAELKKRGVRVLPGGDYGFPFNPNGRNARDLEHFVKLFDFTPSEALVSATKLGGEIMGRGHELGLIKPGYLADLILVDGDPTLDVSILQDKDRLAMIMIGGRFHKQPAEIEPSSEAA